MLRMLAKLVKRNSHIDSQARLFDRADVQLDRPTRSWRERLCPDLGERDWDFPVGLTVLGSGLHQFPRSITTRFFDNDWPGWMSLKIEGNRLTAVQHPN